MTRTLQSWRVALIAATVMVVVLAGSAASQRAAHAGARVGGPAMPGPLICRPWSTVTSPNPGTSINVLIGVAAASANNAFAVGFTQSGTGPAQTLTQHWNGTAWSTISSPNGGTSDNQLQAVSAIPGTSAYVAVGYQKATSAAHPQTLAELWNGTSWSIMPSGNESTNENELDAVGAIAANDIWAVGRGQDANSTWHAMAEHWNGSTWSLVTVPSDGFLYGIAAVASHDVWAVGWYYDSMIGRSVALIVHWNGTMWSLVPGGATAGFGDTLTAVTALGSTNVWAVGYSGSGTDDLTLVEHWDGMSWTAVTSPNPGNLQNGLFGVAAVSGADIWAVGAFQNLFAGVQTLIEHWDGSQWTVTSSPSPGTNNYLTGVASLPGSAWAVGNANPSGSLTQTLIERRAWQINTPSRAAPSGSSKSATLLCVN